MEPEGKENCSCELELSSTKLFKFRKHNAWLKIKKSWRLANKLSEPDVFGALLSARCFLLGSDTEAACKRCKCSPVILLTATSQHPVYDASTDIESYECAIQSRCTSSRDHLKSSLVLVVDRLPLQSSVTSQPFVLLARDKSKPADKKDVGDKKEPLSLFKRNRSDSGSDQVEYTFANVEAFPDPRARLEHPKEIASENGDYSAVRDCTNLLPEAYVSSFLLEKRNKHEQAEEDSKQPPEQRRHVSDEQEPSPEPAPSEVISVSGGGGVNTSESEVISVSGGGGVNVVSPQASPSGANSFESHESHDSHDIQDSALYPDGVLPSYFEGPFSYPRGDNAFSGFVLLSPTLVDLPPYSLNDDP